MRALWTGEIAFGLVSIPVKLYAATKDLAPRFHYLHKPCGTRITTVRRCPHCDVDVPWQDIGKGYEVSKGEYAPFDKDELAALAASEDAGGASGIDIAEFVAPAEVDLAFVERSYWVGPGGKSTRGFALLRDVLRGADKVAIARVRIRTRTRLAMLRPRAGRFSLDMLRFGDELVEGDEIEAPPPAEVTKGRAARELELAQNLVQQMSARFDPHRHPDDYRAAVAAAVERKVEEGAIAVQPDVTEGAESGGAPVIDLAEMLRRSLGGGAAAKGDAKEQRAPAKDEAARGPANRARRAAPPVKARPRSAATKKRTAG